MLARILSGHEFHVDDNIVRTRVPCWQEYCQDTSSMLTTILSGHEFHVDDNIVRTRVPC